MKFFSKSLFYENKNKLIKILLVATLIIASIFLYLAKNNSSKDAEINRELNNSQQETSESVKEDVDDEGESDKSEKTVICDVSGEIKNSKVCELKKGSRVEDAINYCGGLTEKADISGINRAKIIQDGEKIIIPKKGEKIFSQTSETAEDSSFSKTGKESSKININTASNEELQNVTGIGPATADKIVKYRKEKGLFRNLAELKKVKGIGDKKYKKIKENLCI